MAVFWAFLGNNEVTYRFFLVVDGVARSKQALVGRAAGPEGSSAWIECSEHPSRRTWRNDDALHLVVALADSGDAVQLVPPPLPLCPTITSLSPSGDGSWWGAGMGGGGWVVGGASRWLGCVRESLEMLSAVLKRELPATFVAQELLPKVTGWREAS